MNLTKAIRSIRKNFRKEADIEDYNKGIDYSRILDTLRGLMEKYGKQYVFPSQQTLLKLLLENHQMDICLRTLNYRLAEMESLGLIKRIPRTIEATNGKRLYITTAYYLGGAACSAFLEKVTGAARRVLSVFHLQNSANNTLRQKEYIQMKEETSAETPRRTEKEPPEWVLTTMQRCLALAD
ncbi:MAG: hypothetical protein HY884_05385 [Deltaproteobacteria bacterium]|nr:hypothetical protein [Deltaproteobacteria bacterium]